MSNLLELFSIGDDVVVINPNIVQRSKVGVVEQVLDNAILVKIGSARYALQPDDLKFLDKVLQDRLEEVLTLKQANERHEKEILESQLLKQAGIMDVKATVDLPLKQSVKTPELIKDNPVPIVQEPIKKQSFKEQPKTPKFDNF